MVIRKNIEIRKNSLRISFIWRGKRYRETVKLPPSEKNIRFAVSKRNAILYAIATNTFDYAHFFPGSKRAVTLGLTRPDTTVAELARLFFEIKQATLSPQSRVTQRFLLQRCTRLLGEERLTHTLRPEDVARLRAAMAEQYTVRTLNTTMQVLRQFLAFMVTNDYNPCGERLPGEAKRLREVSRDPDPFTLAEFQLLLSCCQNPQDRNILNLMVLTGMRPGELCALAVEDVDLAQGTLRIQRSVTNQGLYKLPKTNKERVIDLYPEAIACLEDQLHMVSMLEPVTVTKLNGNNQQGDYTLRLLFTQKAQRRGRNRDGYRPDTLRRKWGLWTERAKKKDPAFRYRPLYQLRHTYASWNVSLGMDRSYLARQMGHQSVRELERTYAVWMPEASASEQRKMTQRMTGFLAAIATQTDMPQICPTQET